MTITPSPAQAFRVLIRSGNSTIGRTNSVDSLDEARTQLMRMRTVYPDSALEALLPDDDFGCWREVTEEALDRIAYQRAATVLVSLIGEGLAKVNWSLSSTNPGRVEGHLVREEDSREALKAYASLLGCEVTESPHLNGKVQIKAKGAYQGLSVEVWDLVAPVPQRPSDKAEAAVSA